MGVPALFRWLSRKYPKIISPVIEEPHEVVDGVVVPPKYANRNPNGELDNLYLDMNGIVHPCSHPENKPPPETEDEMLLAVFEYTDRVVNMARPRRVLMIAVDGVAPRAKMNQQRARRFRSAKDAQIQDEERERLAAEREKLLGQLIDDSVKQKKTWDSNAITPGTPFMDKLALALRYWTAYKLANDPGWKDLQIIISDATVPGEGEHKIMNFIRSQRSDAEYNPNTRHAIYGLDADLIFLGLATHEPHFRVLREDVFAQDNRGLSMRDHMNMTEEQRERLKEQDAKKPFLWLNINVLREYLQVELNVPRLPFKFDLERAIDDWVFMCFFCGNDFLPHLPSLDVRDNSIDLLVTLWKQQLPRMKSYITCDGTLDLENVETLMSALAPREDNIFRQRKEQEDRRNNRYNGKNDKRRKFADETVQAQNQMLANVTKGKTDKGTFTPTDTIPLFDVDGNSVGKVNLTNKDLVHMQKQVNLAGMGDEDAKQQLLDASHDKEVKTEDINDANKANLSAAAALRQKLLQGKSTTQDSTPTPSPAPVIGDKRSTPSPDTNEDEDQVRLFEPGYRSRYYRVKFHCTEDEVDDLRREVVKHYIEGISWVLLYYYQGCPSWNWYYPYHYAPFASDFVNIKDVTVSFVQGEPFLPYEQLMSVLPAASGHNLPPIFRPLMSDADSPIIDFYPEDFPIDMNGKKMSWQGIVLLPFIDEKRLLEVVKAQYPKLTDAEKSRNVRKQEVLFISKDNANYKKFIKLYEDKELSIIDFHFHKARLAGIVSANDKFELGSVLECPIVGEHEFRGVPTDSFLKLNYEMPVKRHGKSIILTGYIKHRPVLTQEDRDGIIYGNGRGRYGRNNYNTKVDGNVIEVGPYGDSCYDMRFGGFKSFLSLAKRHAEEVQQQHRVRDFMSHRSGHLPPPSRGGYLRR